MTELKKLYRIFLIPAFIIIAAGFGAYKLSSLKQRPSKAAPAKEIATPVTIKKVTATRTEIPLEGYGTIEAQETIVIVPEVSGQIIQTHPKLEVGLALKQGELLFKIVDDEYRHRLDIDKANLARAEFELKEERGRGLVAQREWKLLDQSLKITSLSKELALRKAHEQQKLAAVAGAKGSVELAKLNVARTQVSAPCDGILISEQLGVGQFVNKGTQVATFACTNALKLIIAVPPSKLKWLTPFDQVSRNANASVNGHPAKLVRILSKVDQQTRMIRLLFELPGSALIPNQSNLQPLLLGTFTKVNFTVVSSQPLFTIEEDSVRSNNHVWLAKDSKLMISKIKVLHRSAGQAIVALDKHHEAVQLITSYINAPYQGMPLEIKAAPQQPLTNQSVNTPVEHR